MNLEIIMRKSGLLALLLFFSNLVFHDFIELLRVRLQNILNIFRYFNIRNFEIVSIDLNKAILAVEILGVLFKGIIVFNNSNAIICEVFLDFLDTIKITPFSVKFFLLFCV